MYCESKLAEDTMPEVEHTEISSYPHVEHIKPKAQSKYPELEFVWDNLGYACEVCNDTKGDKYDESCPFVNPCDEDPENFIVFIGAWAVAKKGDERGEYTIDELSLNRDGLLKKRQERLKGIDIEIKAAYRTKNVKLRNKLIEDLQKESEFDREYSRAVKTMLIAEGIL
jgi:hypothetical protein